MTIRKGEPWGEPLACPADVQVLGSDVAVSDWVTERRRTGAELTPVGVSAGDLARTCGGGTGERPTAARVIVDVVRVSIDDEAPLWSVAHVIARRSWWRGEVIMAMNAEYFGRWDVVPRSHPNDGRVDVLRVDAAMSWRDRVQARSRGLTGSHLPHPHLSVTPTDTARFDFVRPSDVWVDGRRRGRGQAITVTVEPDALVLYV